MEARHWRGPSASPRSGPSPSPPPCRQTPARTRAAHSTYQQINLVSDVAGQAQITDPNLVNPWGLSFFPTSPLWVSDNGTDRDHALRGGIHGGAQTINPLGRRRFPVVHPRARSPTPAPRS